MKIHPLIPLFGLTLAACAPTVKLTTPEPVKIDVNMKVNVVTEQSENPKSGEANAEKAKNAASPQERRRLRMQEVQTLKSDSKIGEGNDGFLHIVEKATDKPYARYIDRIVTEENADRAAIFKQQASVENKSVSDIAKDFANRANQSSFPGEWVQDKNGKWAKR